MPGNSAVVPGGAWGNEEASLPVGDGGDATGRCRYRRPEVRNVAAIAALFTPAAFARIFSAAAGADHPPLLPMGYVSFSVSPSPSLALPAAPDSAFTTAPPVGTGGNGAGYGKQQGR